MQEPHSFHLVSTGVSLLTNIQRKGETVEGIDIAQIPVADQAQWQGLLDNPSFIKGLEEIVWKGPMESCAELNTLLRATGNQDPSLVKVYLFGTTTPINELCRRVIERVLLRLGYNLLNPDEVNGYLGQQGHEGRDAAKRFQDGTIELLERLVCLARIRKERGDEVFFNATGGFKAHVMAAAVAAHITRSRLYYMNEDFSDLIFLPFDELDI